MKSSFYWVKERERIMKKFSVTVTKVGCIELYAETAEEAMRMAEESDEEQMYWEGVTATDAEELDEN